MEWQRLSVFQNTPHVQYIEIFNVKWKTLFINLNREYSAVDLEYSVFNLELVSDLFKDGNNTTTFPFSIVIV